MWAVSGSPGWQLTTLQIDMEEREFNLFKFLEIITLRMKFIVIFVVIISVVAAVISFLLPKWYQATVLVVTPEKESVNLGWSGNLDEILSVTAGLRLPVMATPTDVYARILRSRSLMRRVIDANNLDKYYQMTVSDDLYAKVESLSEFNVTPEGLLEIKYIDQNSEMAATVANSFAEQLDLLNREIASSRIKQTKEFIGNRLFEVSQDLDSSRQLLEKFQSQYKAIDLDRQTQLAIESAAELKVELAKNEIELSIKEKSLSPSHPDVKILRRRVDEIRNQISELEFGGDSSSYLNLPISDVPGLKIKYAELSSRVKIGEALYQILSEQYEQAKIQEKVNTPTISIIDKADPPEMAVKPRKSIIVTIAFLGSLIIAIFWVLFLHYIDNLRKNSPEDYERARQFCIALFGWLPGVKSSKKIENRSESI